MRIVGVDLRAGRVDAHLSDLPFAYDIQALDDLERCFPGPCIGAKFEVLSAEIVKCETHS